MVFTVALRNDDLALPLATMDCDGDEQEVCDEISTLVAGAGPVTAEVVGSRDGFLRIISLEAEAACDLIIDGVAPMTADRHDLRFVQAPDGPTRLVFDRLTVTVDGVSFDIALDDRAAFREYVRDNWGRFARTPGRLSPAQGAAAREHLSKRVIAAGDDWAERAKILGELDADSGDETTGAIHDRIDGDQWTAERAALHQQIIDARIAAAASVPRDREAILLGGLPGSGKTSVVTNHNGLYTELGIDNSRYLHLDPDDLKQELLDRNAVDRVPGMTDGEHAALIHQESGHLMDRLHEEATSQGINVIVDKTMSSPPRGEMEVLTGFGYTVRGVFVDVPVAESLVSAEKRWHRGGRFIPPSYIEQSRVAGATSRNLKAFEDVASEFVDWAVVNHRGISQGSPVATIRRGAGAHQFALNTTVFRTYVRDEIGRFAPDAASAAADVVVDGHRVRVAPAAAPALIEDLGNRPESSDLTKVSINGHPNLFATVAHNRLRRVDMPQIPSDRLDDFARVLRQRGVAVRTVRVDPADLAATQNELDGRKVGQMITAIRTGTMSTTDKPPWVSSDGKVLDGHHRWAAEAVLSVGEGPRKMTVTEVAAPMTVLMGMARAFAFDEGIDAKRHGMTVARAG